MIKKQTVATVNFKIKIQMNRAALSIIEQH